MQPIAVSFWDKDEQTTLLAIRMSSVPREKEFVYLKEEPYLVVGVDWHIEEHGNTYEVFAIVTVEGGHDPK